MDDGLRPVTAALSILGAMALIGFVDNFVTVIAGEAGLWQFHAYRGTVSLPLLLLVAWLFGARIRPRRVLGVAGRSLSLGVAMMIYFGALAVLPITQVVAGMFTSPIWVLILSALFRSVRVGPARWAAALAGFAGLLLVVQPQPGNLSVASVLPVLAGAFYATAALATRSWCLGESALGLTFWSFVVLWLAGIVGMGAVAAWGDPAATGFVSRPVVAPSGLFLWLVVLQAVGSLVGVALLIRGYQMAEASYVAIFEYSLILWAALWAWMLWGEVPGLTAAFGMVLIVGAGVVIGLRSR